MFGKSLSTASSLDKAIVACVAAMLGFNLFVLSNQLQAAPAFAKIQVEAGAQQV